MIPGIDSAAGIDHHRLPGVRRLVLFEVEEDLGKQAGIEVLSGLELHLDKE
jgi:hypothetical protein